MRYQRRILSSVTFLASTAAIVFLTGGTKSSAQGTVSVTPPLARQADVHQGSPAVTQERAFLKQYCVGCHSAKLKTGGLSLEALDLNDIPQSGETMEKIVHKVWSGSMPPARSPRPDKPAINTFLTSLEMSLDNYSRAHPFAGHPTMLHRLNRTEYLDAVKDLLDVNLGPDDAALLPADDKGYGFDNNGDVLGVSPLLLERYLSVAQHVSKAALGPAAHSEAPVTVYTETVEYTRDQRKWNEGLPLGTRGGTTFNYRFPADGEYSIRIKLMRNGGRITGFPNGGGRGGGQPFDPEHLVLGIDGKPVTMFLIRADVTAQQPVPTAETRVASLPEPPVKTLTTAESAKRGNDADDALEIRLPQKAGERQISAAFLATYVAVPAQLREPYEAGRGADQRPMGVYSVTVTGPYNIQGPGDTTSRRRIFTCKPTGPQEETTCEKAILSHLATKAYRRPITQTELTELLTAYERGRKDGDFEAGFGMALRRILMDPAFLFRIEHDPPKVEPGTIYRLSDLELASRLSFFLWSSLPDDELLKVAEQNKLRDSAVLDHQVRRMLADPRAHSLVSNFASQWLSLREVGGVQPDPVIFSDFDGLKQAFQRETELFLDSVLLENRNVLELLSANYTFVNERLARHYGIPDVYGSQFRRVSVSGVRGGLLGQGGILTATSYPNRTSPVLRGQWILNNILGSPAPPPPPDIVRDLDDPAKASLPMRERMAEHRANPACAGCHSRMDPLGLALENFDATGKWRTGATTGLADLKLQPIDATGELADGTKFDGVLGLRKVLLEQHSEEFVYTVTERLLTYALGRGAEWYDAPTIRGAMRAAKKDDYHFFTLVLSIVKSTPFQMRMARDAESAQGVDAGAKQKTAAGN